MCIRDSRGVARAPPPGVFLLRAGMVRVRLEGGDGEGGGEVRGAHAAGLRARGQGGENSPGEGSGAPAVVEGAGVALAG